MRTEANGSRTIDPARSYDSVRTTQTMHDEEMKLRVEQQMLNKQIPVNVQPQIVQNLGLTGQGQPATMAYVNPFANTAQPGPFSIKPPLLSDLTGFDLGVDDSSSDYADYGNQIKNRRGQINMLDERSEGELGELDGSDESLGEIMPSNTNIVGRPLDSSKTRQSRYGDQQSNQKPTSMKSAASRPANMMSLKKDARDTRPLGQVQTVSNYEGGGEPTASAYDFHEFDDSTDLGPSPQKARPRHDMDRPIYDSKEDPIPKNKKKGGNNSKLVAMSGESFGGNPIVHSSGGMQEAIKRGKQGKTRGEQIPEDFLENFDDALESGELDPALLR